MYAIRFAGMPKKAGGDTVPSYKTYHVATLADLRAAVDRAKKIPGIVYVGWSRCDEMISSEIEADLVKESKRLGHD